MPSPFPGMDPFIEGRMWRDFHHELISVVRELIAPRLVPRYVTRIEERVYVEYTREAFLTVRERADMAVVTVIEVLSPTNKRPDSDGRREYLRKRGQVLLSPAHLVELDLLRGGDRLPTREPLPSGDYYALVCREADRPVAEVYAWSLSDPLPAIPIPLAEEDEDLVLDLQAVFTSAYDRALYAYSLDYTGPIEPPLSEADAAWAQQRLAARTSG